jgi:hypothetical protein
MLFMKEPESIGNLQDACCQDRSLTAADFFVHTAISQQCIIDYYINKHSQGLFYKVSQDHVSNSNKEKVASEEAATTWELIYLMPSSFDWCRLQNTAAAAFQQVLKYK